MSPDGAELFPGISSLLDPGAASQVSMDLMEFLERCKNPSLAPSGSRVWIIFHLGKLPEEENQTFPGPTCREQSQNSSSGKNSGSKPSCPPTLFSESFPPQEAPDGEQNIPSPQSCPGAPPPGIFPPPAPWNSIFLRGKNIPGFFLTSWEAGEGEKSLFPLE